MAGHLVKYGKHRVRRSYSRIKEVLDLPNLIEVQTDSYKWFLDEGLRDLYGFTSDELADYKRGEEVRHASTDAFFCEAFRLFCL